MDVSFQSNTRRTVHVMAGLLLIVIGWAMSGCGDSKPTTTVQEAAPKPEHTLSFTEVTAKAGIEAFEHHTGAEVGDKWFPESMGSGGGFIDYNGDGWLDILLAGGGAWPESKKDPRTIWLYKNNGDGTFTDKTKEAGLANSDTYSFGISVADYDNDGDQDFFLSTLYENMLFRNDNGTFSEVGQQTGLANYSAWSSSAIFFDADNDGHLDLYVGNYVDWSPENDIFCSLDGEDKAYCTPKLYDGVPARFYHNNGDGTFTDKTKEAGFLPAPGKTLGVAALDYNRDGYSDLVVANDLERDLLYVNNGDGSFTERGMVSGIAFDENGTARAGMGIDVGVVDSTGQPTLFVGNFSNEMIGVYRHVGGGLFIDRAAVSKIGRPSLPILTFGLFLFDPDFDGDLDLFAANGHLQKDIQNVQDGISYRQSPQLYLNKGGGRFKEVSQQVGKDFARPIVARGAAYGDYDRDGDQDILITENEGPAHLLQNNLKQRSHYLRVKVKGQKSNRDGLGAHLRAVVGEGRQERRVQSGSSYLSQSETTVTFGLEEAKQVDSLIVRWPSGQVDRLANIPVDQTIRVVEGAGTFEQVWSRDNAQALAKAQAK